jgi:hypothetical protein
VIEEADRSQRLAPNLITATADGGRLADNIMHFVRLLRAAGLQVGPDRTVLATEALLAAGIENPRILYWTLHAALVSRPEQHEIFNEAFYLVWKDPGFLQQMLSVMLPEAPDATTPPQPQLSRRLADAISPPRTADQQRQQDEIELDASGTWSAVADLRTKDFEQMSADELRRAYTSVRSIPLLLEERRTRRFESSPRPGLIDLRAIKRTMARRGADDVALQWRRRRTRRPPLVVLCDISGSMDAYARIFMHFLYGITATRERVHAFLFGTHLTNITRSLQRRDADTAIARVSKEVTDWSGGTRIGDSLGEFNRRWARRVLGQNATVLLFTDGLDRDGGTGLEVEVRRLAASCRRLVWLNPLMRYSAYEPLAGGARILVRYATETRACHSLASLEDLSIALGAQSRRKAAVQKTAT